MTQVIVSNVLSLIVLDWLGLARCFLLTVSYADAIRSLLGLQSSEGLNGMNKQNGSFPWLAVYAVCQLGLSTGGSTWGLLCQVSICCHSAPDLPFSAWLWYTTTGTCEQLSIASWWNAGLFIDGIRVTFVLLGWEQQEYISFQGWDRPLLIFIMGGPPGDPCGQVPAAPSDHIPSTSDHLSTCHRQHLP